jgi:hypothetical protein
MLLNGYFLVIFKLKNIFMVPFFEKRLKICVLLISYFLHGKFTTRSFKSYKR